MDFDLNKDGDLVYDSTNDLSTITSPSKEVAQNLRIYLQMEQGDNIFEPDRGVPWFEFSNLRNSENIYESLVRAALNSHKMVAEVNDVSTTSSERTMNIECIITTTDDDVITVLLER